MEYRELGKTGVKVSAIGVGTWAAGGRNWGGTDDAKTTEAFHHAIALGINFFDTAPVYGFGHAESVLGAALKGHRDKVFLATKFGLVWKDGEDHPSNDISPASILSECEASLKRLQTDHIDLLQAHWPLPGEAMTQSVAEDMIAALHKLRDAGKVRYFGVSNFNIQQMLWCGGAKELVSDQPPLSILRPSSSEKLIPWCKEQGISVVCYSPLFRGLLTGKYKGNETFLPDDSRTTHPDYSGERFKGICDAAQKLQEYADKYNTTIAGVSINWVLSTPGVTVAIAGTRSKDQIDQAAKGQGWNLTPEECCKISALFKEYVKLFKLD